MPGETLQIGPFIGGINSQSDPTAISDEELVDCINLELEQSGSLVVRPPIQTITQTGILGTERLLLLGVITLAGIEYVIGSNDGGVFYRTTGDWQLITNTFEAAAMVQYDGKAWLVPKIGETNPGGSWDGTTFTADADIPQGGAAAVYKERMFIVPGFLATTNDSRIRFSDAGVFGNWPANNFIDISKGDGQKLVDLQVFKSNLLLFKDHSTYFMAYDGTPFDAIIENVNTTIGPSEPYCVVAYENSIFVYQEGRVYELVNFDYQQANIKVPFFFDGSVPGTRSEKAFLSTIGDRLVARHFNRIYAYGLRTRVWTRWESNDIELQNIGRIVGIKLQANDEYYAGSSILGDKRVFRIKNELDASTDERNSAGINDTFTRSVTDGWGSATSGQAWTNAGGTVPGNYDVNGTQGTHAVDTTNTARTSRFDTYTYRNVDLKVEVKTDQIAVTQPMSAAIMLRYVDSLNMYMARVVFNTNQTATIEIVKRVAAADTVLATATVASYTHAAGTFISIRGQVDGTTLRAKAWATAGSEPSTWTLTATDSTFTIGTVGLRSFRNTGNTSGTTIFTWDNLLSTDIVVDIDCSIRTKNFNLAASHVYKRLNWWGVDILTTRLVTGIVTPIVAQARITWGFLKTNNYKWSDLKGNAWSFPTGGEIFTSDPDIATGTSVTRKFIRFVKALRYRQINFQILVPSNGTTSEGPTRIYWLTMTTSTRQVVDKKVG